MRKEGNGIADIKTRQSNKGTIRTIDRASAMTSHIKDVHARTKEQVSQPRSNDGEQVSSRAQDQMGTMLQRGATGAARFGADAAKAGYRVREGGERMMQRQAGSRTTDAGAEQKIISIVPERVRFHPVFSGAGLGEKNLPLHSGESVSLEDLPGSVRSPRAYRRQQRGSSIREQNMQSRQPGSPKRQYSRSCEL